MSSIPPSYFPASHLLYSRLCHITEKNACSLDSSGVQELAETHTTLNSNKRSTAVSASSNLSFSDLDVWMGGLEK